MMSKKGQGLSLNVIIVAALALIVLVVLIVVFTGRVQVFDEGLSKEGQAELIKQKISYGNCHPGSSFEETFLNGYGGAQDSQAKDKAVNDFKTEITRCKGFTTQDTCQSQTGCSWK